MFSQLWKQKKTISVNPSEEKEYHWCLSSVEVFQQPYWFLFYQKKQEIIRIFYSIQNGIS